MPNKVIIAKGREEHCERNTHMFAAKVLELSYVNLGFFAFSAALRSSLDGRAAILYDSVCCFLFGDKISGTGLGGGLGGTGTSTTGFSGVGGGDGGGSSCAKLSNLAFCAARIVTIYVE
jgi:hypothetical protein